MVRLAGFAVVALLSIACLVRAQETAGAPATEQAAEKTFTLAELAKFDGKEGRAGYIAVDGVVYDVSKAKGWKKGEHKGFKAGADVTDSIKGKSPHGVKVLTKNPVVGKLVAETPAQETPAEPEAATE